MVENKQYNTVKYMWSIYVVKKKLCINICNEKNTQQV